MRWFVQSRTFSRKQLKSNFTCTVVTTFMISILLVSFWIANLQELDKKKLLLYWQGNNLLVLRFFSLVGQNLEKVCLAKKVKSIMPIIFRLRHSTLQRSYVSFKDKLFHKSKSLLNVVNVPVSKSPLGPLMALEIKVKSPKTATTEQTL